MKIKKFIPSVSIAVTAILLLSHTVPAVNLQGPQGRVNFTCSYVSDVFLTALTISPTIPPSQQISIDSVLSPVGREDLVLVNTIDPTGNIVSGWSYKKYVLADPGTPAPLPGYINVYCDDFTTIIGQFRVGYGIVSD